MNYKSVAYPKMRYSISEYLDKIRSTKHFLVQNLKDSELVFESIQQVWKIWSTPIYDWHVLNITIHENEGSFLTALFVSLSEEHLSFLHDYLTDL